MLDIESTEYIRTATSAELKQAVARELRELFDEVFMPQGFASAGKSADYRFKSSDGTQVIRNWLASTGTAPTRLEALLGPQIEITFPQINSQMHRYAPAIMERRNGTYNEAVYLGRYLGRGTHWSFTTLTELRALVRETLIPAYKTHLLPVLAEARTLTGFAHITDDQAGRLFESGRGRWEDWAMAKMITNDPDGAIRVLHEHFRPGSRDAEDLKFFAEEAERRRANH